MRCAIVEYNWYHDLVLPTLVYALNQLGFDVDIYQPRKAFAANPFHFCRGLKYRRHSIDGFLGKLRGTPHRNRRYDLTIANSIEPADVLHTALSLPGPMLAVVHNASLLSTEPQYAAFFDTARRAPIVLSRHIARYLGPDWNSEWIAPIYFGEVPPPSERSDTVNFCVQGNFAFDRRNYDSLLTGAEQLMSAGQVGFKITFVGSSDTPDGRAFRARLARSAASGAAEFSPSGIPYREFYSAVAGADFILPLVDTSTPSQAYYYVDKATTSLMMSIGLGVPPILHSRLAQLYDLGDAGICYENGRLGEAMSEALALRSDDTARLRGRLAQRRESLLAESVANLRRAVEAVS